MRRLHNDWKKMNALMADDAAAAMDFGHKYCKKFEEMTTGRVENISNDQFHALASNPLQRIVLRC